MSDRRQQAPTRGDGFAPGNAVYRRRRAGASRCDGKQRTPRSEVERRWWYDAGCEVLVERCCTGEQFDFVAGTGTIGAVPLFGARPPG